MRTPPASQRTIRSVLLAIAAVAAPAAATLGCGAAKPPGPPPPPIDASDLKNIPADCSRNVEQALTTYINAAKDGSTVKFPAGACYAQGGRIEVRDKRNLTIDGNGASFKSTAPNSGLKVNGNWLVVRGRGVHLTNMKIVGNFHLEGVRSQQRVNEATEGGVGNQFNMGIGIYGGAGNRVTDTTIDDVFGDGITVAVAHYIDGSAADPLDSPREVHIQRVKVTKTARHCYSPSQSDGFWLEDSEANDCWYGGFDGELDNVDQKLSDVHLLRNTFNGFNMFGIVFPVAGYGTNTQDIEIRGNRFVTFPTQACNTIIAVGIYPSNPATFQNVVIEDNTMKAGGVGIAADHVQGGRIQGNRIDYEEKGCGHPPAVRVTNSTDVTEQDNGP
jgi:hypothetical protein